MLQDESRCHLFLKYDMVVGVHPLQAERKKSVENVSKIFVDPSLVLCQCSFAKKQKQRHKSLTIQGDTRP